MRQTITFTRYLVIIAMVGLMLVSGLPMATASINTPVQMVPQNFSALADTVSPAVVHIRVEKTVKVGGSTFLAENSTIRASRNSNSRVRALDSSSTALAIS